MKVKLEIYQSITDKHLIHQKKALSDSLNFLKEMLLYNKIRISDIPKSLRILDIDIYIFALRVSRGFSKQRYMEDLSIMKADLETLCPSQRSKWMHYYLDYEKAVMYCKK